MAETKIAGLDKEVCSVAFVGETLLVGGMNSIVAVGNEEPKVFLKTANNCGVLWMAVSPDGTLLATDDGRKGTLVRIEDKTLLQSWTAKGETFSSMAFSPDGKSIVAVGAGEAGSGSVILVGKERPAFTFHGQRYGVAVFRSPESILCAGFHGSLATLTEYRMGATKKLLERRLGRIPERVDAVATIGGAFYIGTEKGLFEVETESDISYNTPAKTTPLVKGVAVHALATMDDDLVVGSADGVFVVDVKRAKGKARPSMLTKRIAKRLAVSKTRIAFLEEIRTPKAITTEIFSIPR